MANEEDMQFKRMQDTVEYCLEQARAERQSEPPQKNLETRVKDALPIWAKWGIALLLAWLAFTIISPRPPNYGTLFVSSQPVQVSGYTRSDGTQVSGYNRALPGERANANAINQPIAHNNLLETLRYERGKKWAWIGTVFVFCIVFSYLKD